MNSDSPLGLIELVLVLAFVVGFAVLELVTMNMDTKKKKAKAAASARDDDSEGTS